MEGLEFRTAADGCVYYSLANSQEKRLTKFSCDIVNYVIELVRLRFPKTLKRLQSLYEDSDPSERISTLQTALYDAISVLTIGCPLTL